jgi:hypothetical protein
MTKPTRGERNNNPGNIDRGKDKWQGMAADQSSDPRFIIFQSPEFGIRAIARLLLNYQKKGVNTVRKIIDRWAPPVENNTEAYINAVAKELGVKPTEVIDVDDINVMLPLVRAIIRHENGRCIYSDATLREGLRMAGVHNAPPKPLAKQTTVKAQALGFAAVGLTAVSEVAKPVQDAATALAPASAAPFISKIQMLLLTIAGLAILAGLVSAWLKSRATGA